MSHTTSTVPRPTRIAKARLGYLFIAPGAVLVVTFFIFPLGNALYLSFLDFDGISANPPFVGLDNYVRLLADQLAIDAIGRNFLWVIVGTITPLVLGLIMALALWTLGRGSVLYRILFFLPHLLPVVAVGVVWGWIYNPIRGWLNEALRLVGLESLQRGWLGEPDTALWAVLATAIWATYGFVLIILLSALGNVDEELLEAARLDGTNAVQRVWHIVLPQIVPVFILVTTLTLVGGFAVFDIVFVMTGGGPANASNLLGTYAYANAFQLGNLSYGTTLALVILVLSVPFVIALNLIQRRLSLRNIR
ncbi:ABC-type sugar transport system permease subunit [Salinibacterium sp. CAN_S4]|uniref:carbohydrate ABC transporter permease n=1 Tax=Salinibacterium sp. CAN_S4 TaxID=2787727 RepID=UPI0018EF7223